MMSGKIIRLLAAVLAVLAAASCEKDTGRKTKGSGNIDLVIDGGSQDGTQDRDHYTEKLFEVLDLDYPGLEAVKAEHAAGQDEKALRSLKEYYMTRTSVMNPDINLVAPTISKGELNIADQACRERGYRLYVKNYQEGTDPATGLPLYWSFADAMGNLDWNARPGGITERQFAIQRHRHHWMEIQAKAYRVTGDEKYVGYIKDIYGSWLKTYPFPGAKKLTAATFADQWTDLQATDRIMAQINILQYCVRSEAFTPEWLAMYLVEFANHVESVRANPYYSEGSNHRLFEVQAEYTAGVLMPEFKNAGTWLDEGIDFINRQIRLQFRSDGVQGEMDPSYHITVLGIFCEMHALAKQNGLLGRFPEDYTSYLRKAAGFVRDVMYPDYSIDNFNDTRSSSWTPSVLKRSFTTWASLLPEEPGLEWLASGRGKGSAPAFLCSSYPVSGYYMLRDSWEKEAFMLILKNNDNSAQWWHCQPDNGTFGLYRNGRHFTPDAGSYSYGGDSGDNAVRSEFQATKMHNTLTVGLANIAEDRMRGRFVKEVHLEDGTDGYITVNDSYSGLTHRRSVYFVRKKFFVIADELSGSPAAASAELSFHLCDPVTNVSIDDIGDTYGAHTTFADGNNMAFKTFCSASGTPGKESGESWYSNSIGQKTARRFYRVSAPKAAGEKLHFVTVIQPLGSASSFGSLQAEASFTGIGFAAEAMGIRFEAEF